MNVFANLWATHFDRRESAICGKNSVPCNLLESSCVPKKMVKTLTITLGMLALMNVSICAPRNFIPDYKDWNPQDLLKWKPPWQMEKDFPYFMSGTDDEGSPIWIAKMGSWDVKKIIDSGPEAVRNYKLYVLQFLTRCAMSPVTLSTEEDPVDGFNLIVDMKGYGAKQISSPAAIALQLWASKQFEQAISRSVKQAFVLNSGFAFTTIWNLMKPVLGPYTYKVEMLGSNKGRWMPQLMHTLPPDQLPHWVGGNQDPKNIRAYG